MIEIIIILLLLYIIYLIKVSIDKEKFEHFTRDDEYVLPKVIYAFWDNYEENKMIQSHIKNWENKLTKRNWKIIMLNRSNITKYVDKKFLDKFASGTIDSTRFADFLRVHLLKNNGGVWMDASIIIFDGQLLDDMYYDMIDNKYDACFYEYTENTLLPEQPHIDNWFIMAPKNSKIITDLYSEFEKAYDMDFLKYKEDIIIPSGILLDKTIGYEDSTYLLQHAIFHYLFKQGKVYNIKLYNASDSMYKLQTLFGWDHDAIMKFIMDNTIWDGFYAVKLTKGNRAAIRNEKDYIRKLNSI
jgi:hypothetical protein